MITRQRKDQKNKVKQGQVSYQAAAKKMAVKFDLVRAGHKVEAEIDSYTPVMTVWHRFEPICSGSMYPKSVLINFENRCTGFAYRDGISNESGPSSVGVTELGLFQKARILATAFKPAYWQALLVVGLLYFGRFDFTFVTLRAKTVRSIVVGWCYVWLLCLLRAAEYILYIDIHTLCIVYILCVNVCIFLQHHRIHMDIGNSKNYPGIV